MGLLDIFRAGKIRQENEALKLQNNFLIQKNAFLDKKLHDLGCETYEQVQQKCVEVQKQDIVDNGDIAVVLVNGDEATVKCFSRTDNTVVLTPQSMNPAHQVQIYDTKDVPVRVLGKVVESRHKY